MTAISPATHLYSSDKINSESFEYSVFHGRDTSIKLSLPW